MENKKEQFTKVPNSLMCRKDLTDQDKLTLSVIISFINNDKECFIGNDRLGDMLGISKNAASKRILRLESLGCISLRYTYKPNKKEVDKRYITFISIEPQVSPDRIGGISSQTIPYSPTDDTLSPDRRDGVSPKVGGIKQPSLLNNLSNNLSHNLPNNQLHKENVEKQIEELTKIILNDLITPDERWDAEQKRMKLKEEIENLNKHENKPKTILRTQ